MIANRKAVKANFRRLYRSSRVRDVEHYGRVLLSTLRELAPSVRSDPVIALLTPGVYNSAFYEHMFLAGELGAELVEGRRPGRSHPQVVVRGGTLDQRQEERLGCRPEAGRRH